MAKVVIIPVESVNGGVLYRAIAGEIQSYGETAGKALDGIISRLPEDQTNALTLVQIRTLKKPSLNPKP